MHVQPHDVRYGIFWRTSRGEQRNLKGYKTRREAEAAADALTVPHIIHGYIVKRS